jgi:hypothetical protein
MRHASRGDTATPDHVETRVREGVAPGLPRFANIRVMHIISDFHHHLI